MRTLAAATDLLADASMALAHAGLIDDVLVTVDGDEANAAAGQGRALLVLQPPTVTMDTHAVATAEWSLILASQYQGGLDAWEELDDLTDVLIPALDVDRLRPASFQPPHGPPYPAYELTITNHEITP